MHKNYFTLRALAAEFSRVLVHSKFMEAYSHQPGELMLAFIGDDGMHDLRVVTGLQEGCVFLTQHANPPKRNVMRFFEPLAGATVKNIVISKTDRTIVFDFVDCGMLQVRMFGGGGGNVVRFDAGGTMVEFFKKEIVRKTSAIEKVQPKNISWEELIKNFETFSKTFISVNAPIQQALLKIIPALGKPLAEEIIFRSTLRATDFPASIGTDGMAKLFSATCAVIDECCASPQPRVYLDGAAIFALIPLHQFSAMTALPAKDVSDGIRRWTAEHGKSDGIQRERQRIASMLASHREHLERSIEHLQHDLESNKHDTHQQTGELLLTHIAEIATGAKEFIFDGASVALDSRLNAGQNAAAYFAKSKQRKNAIEISKRRLENLNIKLDEAVKHETEFASVHTRDALEAFVLAHHLVLTKMEHDNPNLPKEHPFRSYTLSDECEVFVGKNAKQNDELTFHFAKQNDLWFHVRGAEGSHTILRCTHREGPQKEFILKAAAIAAYHSKSKGSKYVPVLYTQRKFVHKPRGAKPGSVVCTREEVVMVTPGVPVVE